MEDQRQVQHAEHAHCQCGHAFSLGEQDFEHGNDLLVRQAIHQLHAVKVRMISSWQLTTVLPQLKSSVSSVVIFPRSTH